MVCSLALERRDNNQSLSVSGEAALPLIPIAHGCDGCYRLVACNI